MGLRPAAASNHIYKPMLEVRTMTVHSIQTNLFETKPCSTCARELPLLAFGLNKCKRDGLQGYCRECAQESQRRWKERNPGKNRERLRRAYEENREARIKQSRDWAIAHPERRRAIERKALKVNRERKNAQSRKWRELHPERRKEVVNKWDKGNRDKLNAAARRRDHEDPTRRIVKANKRRTRITSAGGSFTRTEWKDLCARYGFACVCCGEVKPLTVDHVIPVSKGGTSYIDNLQPLCKSCNSAKHDKTIDYRLPWKMVA